MTLIQTVRQKVATQKTGYKKSDQLFLTESRIAEGVDTERIIVLT